MPSPGATAAEGEPDLSEPSGSDVPRAGDGTEEPSSGNDPGAPFSVVISGGASAAAVCPRGVTFGDPLVGVGEAGVQSFGAPPGDFFAFLEGPVWIGDSVFFSDNASDPERIFQMTPPSTSIVLFKGDAGSNGLAVDGDDQLLLADERSNRITRVDPQTGEVTAVLLPSGDVTPNDLIARSDGHLYFTDPNRGLFHLGTDGNVAAPINESNSPAPLANANGVVLSLDESLLYVGSVFNNSVSSFELAVDGSINASSGARFVTTSAGTVDGMALDCAGNLYVGTEGGVEVYAPNGERLGVIPTGYASNCTFGGVDRQTLFVTSRDRLVTVRLGVPGLPN